jgi:hypothetical protein
MNYYEVLLGVDRAARDTGRRMTVRVEERDAVSAAIMAERKADACLRDPGVEYTHAMTVSPVISPEPTVMALLAA